MKKIITVTLLLVLSFSNLLVAQNNHSVGAGISYYSFDYKEDLVLPHKSTEYGSLLGWHFFYTYDPVSTPFFITGSGEYTASNIKYDGSTQSGMPVQTDVHITLFRGELTGGYKFSFSLPQESSVGFYTGIGFRSWKRGSILDDLNWLPEYYTWWEIPIGARGRYDIGKRFQISADIRARIMMSGSIEVDMYPLFKGSVKNIKMDLGNKLGMKLQLPVKYTLNDRFAFTLNPWYEYSAIGKSKTMPVYYDSYYQNYLIGYVYEPSSSTNQFGLTFDAQIAFQ